jgi:hypothetical protein
MATVPSIWLGESVEVTFTFEHSLSVNVNFSVSVNYLNSGADATMTDPTFKVGNGSYQRVTGGVVTMTAGQTSLTIRARVNNDPTTADDDSVVITITPLTNVNLITNSEAKAIVEFKNKMLKPVITQDSDTAVATEGTDVYAEYFFDPPTEIPVQLLVALDLLDDTDLNDVGVFDVSFNDYSTSAAVDISGVIDVPVGTEKMKIGCRVPDGQGTEVGEKFTLTLSEVFGQFNTKLRTPITKTFTLVD